MKQFTGGITLVKPVRRCQSQKRLVMISAVALPEDKSSVLAITL